MSDSMDVEWANDSEDKQGLLSGESSNSRQWPNNGKGSRRKHIVHLVALYSIIFILAVCLIWDVLFQKDPSLAVYCNYFPKTRDEILGGFYLLTLVISAAPANSVVAYKTVKYTPGMPGELSPYQGEPTPESTKLWEDLYVGTESVRRL